MPRWNDMNIYDSEGPDTGLGSSSTDAINLDHDIPSTDHGPDTLPADTEMGEADDDETRRETMRTLVAKLGSHRKTPGVKEVIATLKGFIDNRALSQPTASAMQLTGVRDMLADELTEAERNVLTNTREYREYHRPPDEIIKACEDFEQWFLVSAELSDSSIYRLPSANTTPRKAELWRLTDAVRRLPKHSLYFDFKINGRSIVSTSGLSATLRWVESERKGEYSVITEQVEAIEIQLQRIQCRKLLSQASDTADSILKRKEYESSLQSKHWDEKTKESVRKFIQAVKDRKEDALTYTDDVQGERLKALAICTTGKPNNQYSFKQEVDSLNKTMHDLMDTVDKLVKSNRLWLPSDEYVAIAGEEGLPGSR